MIMASLAQQESQSLSQNVRLGLQYRYQQRKVQVNTARFLGYDKDKDGKIANLEQEILKRNRARQECDELGEEVILLREEKYRLQLEDAEKERLRQRIMELEAVLAGIDGKVKVYDDTLARKLIERITVFDDKYVVGFKSGIKIDVRP